MANDPESPNLFNPALMWTDMGLRALDMSVASGQHLVDNVDRMVRAAASAEVAPVGATSAAEQAAPASPASAGLALASQVQRSTFDLATQGWVQWMSTLGTLAALPAARRQAASVVERKITQRVANERAVASTGSGRRSSGSSRAKLKKPRSRNA